MRKPKLNMALFEERRIRVREKLLEAKKRNSAVILFANHELVRNNDVHYDFRQDTNFFYLTGFEEPDSIYIFRPDHDDENVMFVRKKDTLKETWDGFRYGTQGVKDHFFMDEAFSLDEFEEKAPLLLKECDHIYFDLYFDLNNDKKMQSVLTGVKNLQRRSGKGILPISSSNELLGELRVIKSTDEALAQAKASDISAEAHLEVMKRVKPGMNEKELHGIFLASMMKQGASREGYGGIFATGHNATTLHYVFNDDEIKDGDLVLVDAGAEFEMFTGDITRTYPANGKFNSHQKRVYNKLLKVQEELIEMVKPGRTFKELNQFTIENITKILLEEEVLQGELSEHIEKSSFTKYYPHGVSHYLGMDVHDAGLYQLKGEPRPLVEGMIFTIEPGIYLPADDESVPKPLRGMGIRIEDNILVTEKGHTNLTAKCPKSVKEIEALMRDE